MSQINPSVTTPTIADIYQDISTGRLILAPDFQRKFVWTHEHQEEFLDTILNGYPFPEIYVCQGSIDLVALKTTQVIIDGQQRLTTIKRYIEGVENRPLTKVPAFKDLGSRLKDFLSYKIVMRDIGIVDEAIIKDIFRRINLTKFKLEDVEIHNAVYDGLYIQTAKSILKSVDLRRYGVFYESEFSRMADLHFILLVMSTIENNGYFPEDKNIENSIKSNNEEYPNQLATLEVISKTFELIDKIDLEEDSIWFRKSNFFTLVVETAWNIERIPSDYGVRLRNLEVKIYENRRKPENEYGLYYRYMYQGTNQRKARITRSAVFRRDVFDDAMLMEFFLDPAS